MKGLMIAFVLLINCLMASSLWADIYEWTDENGVRHFTNYAPPDDAKIIMKTKELPFDEAADRKRRETEERQRLMLARLELAEREADLERRELEAQRRLIEADREAEDMLQEAEEILNTYRDDRYPLRSSGWGRFDRGFAHSGFYQVSPFFNEHPYNRWYYRGNRGSIYFTTPSKKHHSKRRYYRNKHHHGHKKGYHRTKLHHRPSYRPKHHVKSSGPHRFKSRGSFHGNRGRAGRGGIRVGFRR